MLVAEGSMKVIKKVKVSETGVEAFQAIPLARACRAIMKPLWYAWKSRQLSGS
jgi:hypothetical protein